MSRDQRFNQIGEYGATQRHLATFLLASSVVVAAGSMFELHEAFSPRPVSIQQDVQVFSELCLSTPDRNPTGNLSNPPCYATFTANSSITAVYETVQLPNYDLYGALALAAVAAGGLYGFNRVTDQMYKNYLFQSADAPVADTTLMLLAYAEPVDPN